MSPQDILRRSWTLTAQHPGLQIFGTLSALFSILIGIPRLHYILRTDLIGWERIYDLLRVIQGSPTVAATTVISSFALLYIGSFFVHVISEGAVIAAITKAETSGAPVSRRTALALGLQSFLRLVEFKGAVALFSITSMITYVLLFDFYSARFLDGVSIVREFLPLTVFICVVVATLSVLFTYAEYHFIAQRSTIIDALKRSARLVLFYLSETMLLTMLLVLIFLRTLLNVLLVFVVPGAALAATSFLTIRLAPELNLAILLVVGIVSIWYAARISGVLMVYTHAVWTLTYLHLQTRNDHVVLHTGERKVESRERKPDEVLPATQDGAMPLAGPTPPNSIVITSGSIDAFSRAA